MNNFILNLPYASLRLNEKKVSFREYLFSGDNTHLNRALLKVFPRFDIDVIEQIVKETPGITTKRMQFITKVLTGRYEKVLTPAYKKAQQNKDR
jgi:hypothetical protein